MSRLCTLSSDYELLNFLASSWGSIGRGFRIWPGDPNCKPPVKPKFSLESTTEWVNFSEHIMVDFLKASMEPTNTKRLEDGQRKISLSDVEAEAMWING